MVAPVRDTCAQVLGVVCTHMTAHNVQCVVDGLTTLARCSLWEVRHGALLVSVHGRPLNQSTHPSITTHPSHHNTSIQSQYIHPITAHPITTHPSHFEDVLDAESVSVHPLLVAQFCAETAKCLSSLVEVDVGAHVEPGAEDMVNEHN